MLSKTEKLIWVIVGGCLYLVFSCTKTDGPPKPLAQVLGHKKNNHQWVVLNLAEDMSLTELSQLTGKTKKELLKWNPVLRKSKPYAGQGIGMWLTPEEERLLMDNSFLRGVKHNVHGPRVQKVISYTVKGNETPEYLVKKYHSDLFLLARMNDSTKLSVMAPGTILKIPVLKKKVRKRAIFSHKGSKTIIYRVKPSDTAWKISRRYKVNLKTLQKFNPGLDLRHIQPGTRLEIPVKNREKKGAATVHSD